MSASKATSIEPPILKHGRDRASFNVRKDGAMEVTIEKRNGMPRCRMKMKGNADLKRSPSLRQMKEPTAYARPRLKAILNMAIASIS